MDPLSGYEELLQVHSGRLRRLCQLLLADGQEAEEVVQEVFVKALEAERRQGPPADWGRWLTRIAVNTCHDRRRAGWWTQFRHWSERIEEIPIADERQSPEEAAISGETRQRVWLAFRALPDRQREVFVLRHLEGWSGAEIAAALGLSPGSVKRHLFRAVHRLRESLGRAP
ncbi:MAG: sigma-70 family RNA polymerase sigma factor [Candidatus Rokubacteria bacterium]|nr:sigma-70 family RNA polymerase sigma factor [Candidatus Rokubacteria bacterium]